MVDFDADQTSLAEASIDALIERRAEERDEVNTVHAAWAVSERRFLSQRESEIRTDWILHYQHRAAPLRDLAAENEANARQLMDGAARS